MPSANLDFLKEKKIYKYIGDTESQKQIAKELADAFSNKMTNDNVDYEFDISQGGQASSTYVTVSVVPVSSRNC